MKDTYFIVDLEDLVSWLNGYLKISEFEDQSINGLQVEASRNIRKICVAVDACMETFERAKYSRCDLLIVHHGLYWRSLDPLIYGIMRSRIAFLLQNHISLYAAHLPLDAHPEVGNNVEIIRKLGFRKIEPFNQIGWIGEVPEPIMITDLFERVKQISSTTRLWNFGPTEVKRIYVSSGGSTSFIFNIPENSTFITGEFLHYGYHYAKEKNINVISMGHYESEKFGVIALASKIESLFKIPWQFIDVPTDL